MAHRAASPLRAEAPLAPIAATAVAFLIFGHDWLGDLSDPVWLGFIFAWLFATVLWAAIRVVHHADCLAVRLGEPYGTLVLTLSVIAIEVLMISALMLSGDNNPTLARDTMYAVAMIVLCGLVGLTLLVGALRWHEQSYNLQGANAYLSVIIPLVVLTLALPTFTVSTPEPTLSPFQELFVVVTSIGLYGAFLAIQTVRHTGYFTHAASDAAPGDDHAGLEVRSIGYHTLFLLAYLLAVVLLAEKVATPIDYCIENLGWPPGLGGFVVAMLVLTPEGIGAIAAAWANRLQRSVNLLLGSVLATIALTAPAVLVISVFTGHPIELGLQNADLLMLLLALVVSAVTFSAVRTNVLQGVVHLILFLAYVMLIFAP